MCSSDLLSIQVSLVLGSSTVSPAELSDPRGLATRWLNSGTNDPFSRYFVNRLGAAGRLELEGQLKTNAPVASIAKLITNALNQAVTGPALQTITEFQDEALLKNAGVRVSVNFVKDSSRWRNNRRILDQALGAHIRPAEHWIEVSPEQSASARFLASTLILHLGVIFVMHGFLRAHGKSWDWFLG